MHPTVAAVAQGLYGIPTKLAPLLADYISSKSGVLPFLAESMGIKDFYTRVQEPLYQRAAKADDAIYD